MASFQLNLVTPVRELFNTTASMLVAPGVEGYLGVQYGHLPMAVELKTGLIVYRDAVDNRRYYIWVSGGIIEIRPDEVHIIADSALRPDEIDVEQTRKALEEVRKVLKGELSTMSSSEAMIELEEASARLKVAALVSEG